MKIRLLCPKNVEIRKRIRESCPGFFLWEKCAGIPMDILPDYTDLFSKKNFDAICKFVKKTYVPFSLADCRHFLWAELRSLLRGVEATDKADGGALAIR